MKSCWPLIAVSFMSFAAQSVAATTSYHVGNSLTWDGLGKISNGELGLEALAAAAGHSHRAGYHLRCAYSLAAIIAEPELTCIPPREEYGLFTEALPSQYWDFVTLQPHGSPGSTLGSDVASITSLIDLTRSHPENADTVFYIYEAWPPNFTDPYSYAYDLATPDDLAIGTIPTRSYFDHLIRRVDEATDATVRVIPVGKVLYQLSKTPGFRIGWVFRDSLHMSDLGLYVAATTMYATTFADDPAGQGKPPNHFGAGLEFTPELVALINKTVWDVVSSDRNTGISDFNEDGSVDATDFGTWTTGFGATSSADANGDGFSNGEDFLIWQRHWGDNGSPSFAAPEPPASLLAAIPAIGWLAAILRHRLQAAGRNGDALLNELLSN